MKITQSHFGTFASCGLALTLMLSMTSVGQPAQAQSHAVKPSMEARSAFATGVENQLRQRGIDARVQLDGEERDVLRIDWQGVNRQDIYGFVTSDAVRNGAGSIAFKSIAFRSGNQRWDYDLARESMVWSPSQPE